MSIFSSTRDIMEREQSEKELERHVEELFSDLRQVNEQLRCEIKERKQGEIVLRQSEKWYRQLFNSGNDAIFVHDISSRGFLGKFLEVNEVACQHLGYTREELLQLSPLDIYDTETSNISPTMVGKFLAEKHLLFEMTLAAKDGKKIPVEINAHFFEFNDQPTVLSITRNITERKKREAIHRDRFISMMSHELRTPLTTIRGFVEILEHQMDKLDQAHREQSFEILNRNVRRLERLIADVSTLGQIERKSFRLSIEEMDFCTFLPKALESYQTFLGTQLEVQSYLEDDSVLIEGDSDYLLQILDNLLENAVKHTDPDHRRILVTLEIQSNVVGVRVADNGAGIAPEDLNHIFEPFKAFSTQFSTGGTGIGLYISRRIAEAHGGSLTAYSMGKGQGATFVLELPRVRTKNT